MILMRGLPSCGKSTTARRLVQDGGIVIEFDEYFYRRVGSDPRRYDWRASLLPEARRSFFRRIKEAVDAQTHPIVVDNDNTLHRSTADYVSYAIERGYAIQFREPDSPWWRQIRKLLDDKQGHAAELRRWAAKLALLSRCTHRVPVATFQRRIAQWQSDLTVGQLVRATESRAAGQAAVGDGERFANQSLGCIGSATAHATMGD